jgi:hypothetical protein
MKYVITTNGVATQQQYPQATYHCNLHQHIGGDLISAAHYRIVEGNVVVFGESMGYGTKARKEDAEIISKALFTKN